MRDFCVQKIEAFRSVKSHIHAVNSAIGPLIMASVVQMIPYGVLIIHLVSKAKTLDQLPWLHMFIMVIKLGHIIVASEAAANVIKIYFIKICMDKLTVIFNTKGGELILQNYVG